MEKVTVKDSKEEWTRAFLIGMILGILIITGGYYIIDLPKRIDNAEQGAFQEGYETGIEYAIQESAKTCMEYMCSLPAINCNNPLAVQGAQEQCKGILGGNK